MNRWEGRFALVTGAYGGIGAAICEELLNRKMKVIGVGRDEGKIATLSNKFAVQFGADHFTGYQCDLTDEKKIKKMYEEFRKQEKHIQLCINCAVIIRNSSLMSGLTRDWNEMLNVGILGLSINTREAVQTMLELKDKNKIDEGQIIQMVGIVGHKIPNLSGAPPDTPQADLHFYNGIKFMVRALTEGLRQEVKPLKFIRVSAISPGSVETELLEKAIGKEPARAYFAKYKCLEPKDVAAAVNYILSTPLYQNVHDIIMEPVAFQV